MPIEVVEDREDDRPARKPMAKYPNAKKIFALFPGYSLVWTVNRQFCMAAENLFETRGIDDCKEALSFAEKHKDENFCPRVYNPLDLDMKWDKLVAYSLKK